MYAKSVYVTHDEPVPLQKVGNGLWVVSSSKQVYSPEELKTEMFRYPELFKRSSKKRRQRMRGLVNPSAVGQ